MQGTFNSPILFIVFNRPNETLQVFNSIKSIKPSKLYIAADGPRLNRIGEVEKCNHVRDIFKEIDWDCEVFKLYRDSNLGCGLAVSSAISWFFEYEEMGIILEDDCLPDFSFFNFCDNLLKKYKNDYRIMHISGFSGGIKGSNKYSYHFSIFPRIWGWATWKRAWDFYDFRMSEYSEFESIGGLDKSVKNWFAKVFWKLNFRRIVNQRIDTWDFQWVYALLCNNGLSIIPNTNLIKNIGFSEDATHTVNSDNEFAQLNLNSIESDLVHPTFVFPDLKAEMALNIQFIGKGLIPKLKLGLKYLIHLFRK